MTEEMMQVQVQKMCRELSLDRKQSDRVCRASRRIARQREKLAETCRESAAEVQQVLTPEQFAQWQRYAMPSMDMKNVYRVDPQVMMRRDRTRRYDGPKGPKCQTGDCPRVEQRRRGHRHHRRAMRMDNTQTNTMQTAVEILPAE